MRILAKTVPRFDRLNRFFQRCGGGGFKKSLHFLSLPNFSFYCERLITVPGDAVGSTWNINKGPNYEFEVRPLSAEAFLFARLIMRLPFTC